MRHILFCIFTTVTIPFLMTAQNSDMAIAKRAFDYWQKGEAGKGYDEFKALLDSTGFFSFAHPLSGSVSGKAGYVKLIELISSREITPNNLAFTNIKVYAADSRQYCFQFDSKGTIGGAYSYEGFNIIQLTVRNGKVIAFREYFGYVDAAWFK